jgi:transposase-like protein
MSTQRPVFPESFKCEAVDRVAISGLSAGGVTSEVGLHETVLRRWMVQFGAQASGAACRYNTQALASLVSAPACRAPLRWRSAAVDRSARSARR